MKQWDCFAKNKPKIILFLLSTEKMMDATNSLFVKDYADNLFLMLLAKN